MRRRGWIVIGLVLLLVGGGAAWWLGRGGKPAAKAGAGAGATGKSDADVLAQRRAAQAARGDRRTPAAVSGTVADAATGAPIAGAVVYLSPQSFLGPRDDATGVAPPPLTATSDAAGAWSVAAVPPGRWRAGASARGYQAGGLLDVVIEAGKARRDVAIRLAPGGRALVGKVSDVGGGPVAGAVVSAQSLTGASLLGTTTVPAATLTDEQGAYRLDLREGLYIVSVEHDDYVPVTETTTVRGAETVLDVVLTPGGTITGVVLSRADRRPVAGALVLAKGGRSMGGDDDLAELGALIGAGGVLTDAAGRFTLRGLGSGAIEIDAVARAYRSREPTIVELAIAETRDGVEILVDPAFTISGFVVRRGQDDDGVPGVIVGGVQLKNDIQPTIFDESDELGYFELPGVAPGKYGLVAAKDGLLPNLLRTTVTVVDQDVTDVLLVVDVGATLRGRVEPPGPATLSLQMKEDDFSFTMIPSMAAAVLVHGRAADDGTFELPGVPPGSFFLAARTDDGRAGELAVTVGADDVNGLVVKLERRAAIAGRVVDDRGQPLGGVEVGVWAQGGKDRRIDFGEIGKGDVRTAPDGSFEALGLDPATYSLHVSDAEGGIDWAEGFDSPSVTLQTGERKDGVELRVAGRRGVIRGRVIDQSGAPVADAWVGARRGMGLGLSERPPGMDDGDGGDGGDDGGRGDGDGNGGGRVVVERGGGGGGGGAPPSDEDAPDAGWGGHDRAALTGADGRFELRGLRSGKGDTYDLSADAGGARGHKRGVKPDADVTLRLRPLGGLAGRVSIGGEPVKDYRVAVEGPVGRQARVMDDDGRYSVPRLDAGAYKVRITSDVGAKQVSATVKAGEVTTVDVALEPWGEVTGRIVDAMTGAPLAGLNVMASSLEVGDPGEQALGMFTGDGPKTDKDGRFRVGKLGPGKGYVVAFSGMLSGFEPVHQSSFELQPGEKKDLGDLKGLTKGKVDEDERGTLGLSTSPAEGDATRLAVYHVDETGPARTADVRVGDRITQIDGRGVDALGVEIAGELLSPGRLKIGQSVSLTLERDGKPVSVTLVAVALSPPAPAGGTGTAPAP